MTQEELYLFIIKLKCCTANYADKISTKLQHGFYGKCDETLKLMFLNGFIELLTPYKVDTDTYTNCITEIEFDDIINKSKNICNLCDCN